MKKIRNFINNEYRDGSDAKTFPKLSPLNNEQICEVSEASKSDVDLAVKSAKKALKGPWGKITTEERVTLLYKVADEITRRFEDFVEAEVSDTGMPQHTSQFMCVRGAQNFKVFADVIKNVPTEFFEMATPDGKGAMNYAIRRPVGVVGVVCPWNAPLLLMTWKVGPALACGNTVVVKPSEETPQTAALLGEVMRDVGIPEGVYNVVHGFGPNSTGEFLTTHQDVDAITFTGETRTGAAIMKAAADGARPVSLEMGGKNAAIVFADCDLEVASEALMRSCFMNTGQVCLGTERVFVERPLFVTLVSTLKDKVSKLKIGIPTDHNSTMGPLISKEHQAKVLSYYKKAVEEGANVVIGGGVPKMEGDLANGSWIEPTIWTGLNDDATIAVDEIFGPCTHIFPFDSEEEVIERANNTIYGLSSAVFTRDLTRAHRVAAQIEAGVVWVNSWFLRDLRTAFGGAKNSGIGREGGVHSLEFYTELKNVCIKL